jgi:hypothetical protein
MDGIFAKPGLRVSVPLSGLDMAPIVSPPIPVDSRILTLRLRAIGWLMAQSGIVREERGGNFLREIRFRNFDAPSSGTQSASKMSRISRA